MTGANTDPITMPAWETASCILLRIAHQLFDAAIHQTTTESFVGDVTFEHWHSLRSIAVRYLENRSTLLPPVERERMISSLKFAHEFHHKQTGSFAGVPIRDVESCSCSIASELRELALIHAKAQEAEFAAIGKENHAAHSL